MILAAQRNLFTGSFNPLSLSPALWLSDTGSNPAQWNDLSGNGRHATQAIGAIQPAIVTNALNGRQVRRFDGVNDLLQTASNFSASFVEVYAVSNHAGFGGGGFGRIIEIGFNAFVYFVNQSTENAQSYRLAGGSLLAAKNSLTNSATTGFWRISGGRYDLSGNPSSMIHTINGVVSSGTETPGSSVTISNLPIQIGNRASLDRAFNGDIAEILVFPTGLSTENRRRIEGYLSSKYAIAIS
jgi:hypothetical protein